MFPFEPYQVLCDNNEEEVELQYDYNNYLAKYFGPSKLNQQNIVGHLKESHRLSSKIILAIIVSLKCLPGDSITNKINKNNHLQEALQYTNGINYLDYMLGLLFNGVGKNNIEIREHLGLYFYNIILAYKVEIHNVTNYLNHNSSVAIFQGELSVDASDNLDKKFLMASHRKDVLNISRWMRVNNSLMVRISENAIKYLLSEESICLNLAQLINEKIYSYQVINKTDIKKMFLLNEPEMKIRVQYDRLNIFILARLKYNNIIPESVFLNREHSNISKSNYAPEWLHASIVYRIFINDNSMLEGCVEKLYLSSLTPAVRECLGFNVQIKPKIISKLKSIQNQTFLISYSESQSILQEYTKRLLNENNGLNNLITFILGCSDNMINVVLNLILPEILSHALLKNVYNALYNDYGLFHSEPLSLKEIELAQKIVKKKSYERLLKKAIKLFEISLNINENIRLYYRFFLIDLLKQLNDFQHECNCCLPELNKLLINEVCFEQKVIFPITKCDDYTQLHQMTFQKLIESIVNEMGDSYIKNISFLVKIKVISYIQNALIYFHQVAERLRFHLSDASIYMTSKDCFFSDSIEKRLVDNIGLSINIIPLGIKPYTIDPFINRLIMLSPIPSNSKNQYNNTILIDGKVKDSYSKIIVPLDIADCDLESMVYCVLLQLLILPYEQVVFTLSDRHRTNHSGIMIFNYLKELYDKSVNCFKQKEIITNPDKVLNNIKFDDSDLFKRKRFLSACKHTLFTYHDASVNRVEFSNHTKNVSEMMEVGMSLLKKYRKECC